MCAARARPGAARRRTCARTRENRYDEEVEWAIELNANAHARYAEHAIGSEQTRAERRAAAARAREAAAGAAEHAEADADRLLGLDESGNTVNAATRRAFTRIVDEMNRGTRSPARAARTR